MPKTLTPLSGDVKVSPTVEGDSQVSPYHLYHPLHCR
jgi:hypothetical protein